MRALHVIIYVVICAINLTAQPGNPALRSLADPDLKPFYHGVASGDPTATSVIIWTRVTPEAPGPVSVAWQMAADTLFQDVVAAGNIITDADRDYTVKVDVTGLQPGSWYYYEFTAGNRRSLTGRTKTAPDGMVDQLRFAVVSCSKYRHGYFNVYDKIYRRNDIDGVIHLGDYIYEEPGESDIVSEEWPRVSPPDHELIVLGDYRLRHAVHKLDSDSRKMHQNYPLIAVWDDHESCDNSWRGGADNHDEEEDGPWPDRLAASIQAYYEWMPLRQPDAMDEQRIFRKISYGDLADLYMIDTRIYDRDLQAEDPDNFDDPDRRLIGPVQMEWLMDNMRSSTATYQVIGQQVVMAPLVIPDYTNETFIPVNNDQWDGYAAERSALYDFILQEDIRNMIVLTGDIHTGWSNDLPYDIFEYDPMSGAGSVGVEFVCNSVTSNSLDFPFPLGELLLQTLLPYIKYVELYKKGYVILDLDAQRAQGDNYTLNTVTTRDALEFFKGGWYMAEGTRHLVRGDGKSTDQRPMAPLAPDDPRTVDSTATGISQPSFDVLGVYPNPFRIFVALEAHLFEPGEARVSVYDSKAAVVFERDYGKLPRGRSLLRLELPDLPAGSYEAVLKCANARVSRRIIKVNR